MKRILLSLLTCSICLNVFAQIDTSKKINPGYSDKWEIIKGNIKSTKSKLLVSLPADAHWDMTIYATGSNKVLSNTLLKKEILLLPGSYDVEINKIRITGVPVEKGNNTRLKAGVLNITTPDSWTLYDETQQTVLINTYSEQKRGLPVGKYILVINGQAQAIEIKDEHQVDTGFVESPYYEISPLEAMTEGLGKLSIITPQDTIITILDKRVRIPYNIRDTVKKSESGNTNTYYERLILPKYLTAKPYPYYISLSNVRIRVPVRSGHETRIKAGFLIITKKETEGDPGESAMSQANDQIFGSDDSPDITWNWKLIRVGQGYIAFGKKRAILALPPGEYHLVKINPNSGNDIIYSVTIKDGEWVKNGKRQ